MVDQGIEGRDVDALRAGGAWVDLSRRRIVRVVGPDAIGWLHDLLTADIAGLASGEARRSLLLTPTGHIRADVHVVRRQDDVVLIQDREQPEDIGAALEPFVLSSDVRLDDASGDLVILAVPGRDAPPTTLPAYAVSCLDMGIDVIAPTSQSASTRAALIAAGIHETSLEAAEALRIERGIARMGHDFDRRSLPSEAGLDHVIDATKGCFLGQESVARVRNLGHPPRVLRHVGSDAALPVGSVARTDASDVGEVTSATRLDGRSIALVRVAWSAATARLADSQGHPMHDVDPPG
jgi:tRNA-modifying protein YgfZ